MRNFDIQLINGDLTARNLTHISSKNNPLVTVTSAVQYMPDQTCSANLIAPKVPMPSIGPPILTQIFSFNCASGKLGYCVTAQRFSRSYQNYCAESSNIYNRKKTAEFCGKGDGVIAIAAHAPQHLIQKLGAVLKCLQKASPELTLTRLHFEVPKVHFLPRTMTTKKLFPQKNHRNFRRNLTYIRSERCCKVALDS